MREWSKKLWRFRTFIMSALCLLLIESPLIVHGQSGLQEDSGQKSLYRQAKEMAPDLYPEVFAPRDEFETSGDYEERVKQQREMIKVIRADFIAEHKRIEAIEEAKANERILSSHKNIKLSVKDLGKYHADEEYFEYLHLKEIKSKESKESANIGYLHRLFTDRIEGSIVITDSFGAVYSMPSTPAQGVGSQILVSFDDVMKYEGKRYNKDYSLVYLEFNPGVRIKKFSVPISEARALKEHISRAEITGEKILTSDLTNYNIYNIVLTHPTTKNRFFLETPYDISSELSILNQSTNNQLVALDPPDLLMDVAFIESNQNGFLDGDEQGRIIVSIKNEGKGGASALNVKIRTEKYVKGLEFQNTKYIDKLGPGGSTKIDFLVSASSGVKREQCNFEINATEANGFPPSPVAISFETFPIIPASIELADYAIQTATNDNILQSGVTTDIRVRVQNRGRGPSRELNFELILPSGIWFTPTSNKTYKYSILESGDYKDLDFSFTPNKRVGDQITLYLKYSDEQKNGKFPIQLSVDKPEKTIQQMVVVGKESQHIELPDVSGLSIDIEKNIPSAQKGNRNDLAVVFGIESYKNISGVTFARRDAKWVQKYFSETLGISEKRIYSGFDRDVTQGEFHKVFDKNGWLDKRVKKGETNIYVYYAGHGAPEMSDGEAYLVPYDGDPNYAMQTGYALNKLYEDLGSLGAQSVTVFLDACFAGADRNSEVLLKNARPIFIEVESPSARGISIFTASSSNEISTSWPEKKHGLFSYYLMKGMQGEADKDKNGNVTMKELGDYIRENVSDTAGILDREQTPYFSSPEHDRVLIKY